MNELAAVEKEVTSVTLASTKMVVKTSEDALIAMDFLKNVSDAKKKVEVFFAPQLGSAHTTWQTILAQKKEYMTPLEAAEKLVKGKKTTFDLEQMRIAEEAQRVADEKARIAEEKLKVKIQKKIDKTEDEETAAVLQEQLEMAHVQRQVVEAPTKIGTSQKDVEITINNMMLLVKAVASGEVGINPEMLFEVKMKVLKDYVKLSGKMDVPGCTIRKTLIQKIR
jgi:hypothetical protein